MDPEREPPELDGVPGWRRLKGGAPHPEDLRDIVDAVLKVTRPKRVLLFGSGARGEMTDDSDIDILVIDEAPGGTPKLKLAIGNALPMGLRWTDVLVLTPAGLRKRLHEWEDETLAEVLGEARTLYRRRQGRTRKSRGAQRPYRQPGKRAGRGTGPGRRCGGQEQPVPQGRRRHAGGRRPR